MKNINENANKLQEVIVAKTLESVKAAEAPVKKEKAVKAKAKETKEKVASKKETPKEKVVKAVKKKAEVNLVEEVVTKREVKYKYPADCTDTLSRKKHGQAVRNKLHQLELEMYRIENKDSKEFKKKEKEYNDFKKANLKEGAAA